MNKVKYVLLAALAVWSLQFSAAKAAQHVFGSNIISPEGTVFTITQENGQTVRRPYTSPGAFLSYSFNTWDSVVGSSVEDMALPIGTFIAPQDGKIICSDRGSDKGTCYLITNHQKAGFTSANIFTGLGYSFDNVMSGDVSFLPSTTNIDSTSTPHNPGTLINKNGTIYLVGNNGLVGLPDWNTLQSWGYTAKDIVPSNSSDNNLLVVGNLPGRQPQYLAPLSDAKNIQVTTPIKTSPSDSSQTPTITVISPNGGESLVAGQTYYITWKSSNVNAVKISLCGTSNYLGYICHPLSYIPDSGINAALGIFSWSIDPNDPYIPGSVKIRITQVVSNGSTAVYGESAGTFTLSAASAQASYITATKNSAFGDQNVIPNQTNVKIGSYVLNAPASEGAKISSITLMSNNQNASASFQNVRLINGANATQFGATQVSANGAYSFNGLINIPAGGSIVLDVYADILASATGSANPATVLENVTAVGATSNASMQINNQVSGQNITFGTVTTSICSLTAQVVGTHLSTDNTSWGFDVIVNAVNPPTGSTGWTANFQGYVPTVTSYGKSIHYGDFFTSYGPLQLTARDQVNSNCSTSITVSPPPAAAVSASPSLKLSLNSSSPTGQTITAGGTGYTFLIFDLTAGSAGNVSISGMNFGVSGAVGPYVTNLKLFNVSDNSQIYSGSNTTAQTFNSNLVIPAGSTKTLKLVGDVSAGATAGSQLLLALVNTNVTLSSQSAGTAITGSAWPSAYTHTVTAATPSASLSASMNSAFPSATVSQNSVSQKIGSYTLTAPSDQGVNLSSVTVQLIGSQSSFANLMIKVNGNLFGSPQAPGISNTFNATSPILIPANSSITLDLFADIANTNSGNLSTATQLSGCTGLGVSNSANISCNLAYGQIINVNANTLPGFAEALKASSPQDQNVTGGSINVPAAIFNVTTSGSSITIQKMVISINNYNNPSVIPVVSITVGGLTAPVIGSTATISGLNITVPNGGSGTDIPVVMNLATVGLNGVPANQKFNISLGQITYLTPWNQVANYSGSFGQVGSNTFTLVAP